MLLHIKSFSPSISIPEGFVLVVDTREQAPLFFDEQWVVRKGLKQGDYSIVGFEEEIVVERKNIADLYSTLGKGRDRFKREVERLEGYKWKGLLIEGGEDRVYTVNKFSALHPNSLYHSLSSLEVNGFHIYYAKDKRWARWWVLSRLTRWYKYKREGKV